MMTITVNIDAKGKDINDICKAAVTANLAQLKYIEKLVEDIRDPVTGEAAKFSWDIHASGGIEVSIKGSDFVRAEAERRISAAPKPAPVVSKS